VLRVTLRKIFVRELNVRRVTLQMKFASDHDTLSQRVIGFADRRLENVVEEEMTDDARIPDSDLQGSQNPIISRVFSPPTR